MKTTIDISDALFAKAKVAAAERRTTLKAIIEHALRRELSDGEPNGDAGWSLNEFGFPVLESENPGTVTSEQIYSLLDEE